MLATIAGAVERLRVHRSTNERLAKDKPTFTYGGFKATMRSDLSKHTVARVRAIFVRTDEFDVDAGIWTPLTNTARNIKVQRFNPGDENDIQVQVIPLRQIPTAEQDARLIDLAWRVNPMRTLTDEIAARLRLH